jgi:hypothetical protein
MAPELLGIASDDDCESSGDSGDPSRRIVLHIVFVVFAHPFRELLGAEARSQARTQASY